MHLKCPSSSQSTPSYQPWKYWGHGGRVLGPVVMSETRCRHMLTCFKFDMCLMTHDRWGIHKFLSSRASLLSAECWSCSASGNLLDDDVDDVDKEPWRNVEPGHSSVGITPTHAQFLRHLDQTIVVPCVKRPLTSFCSRQDKKNGLPGTKWCHGCGYGFWQVRVASFIKPTECKTRMGLAYGFALVISI